MDWRKFADVDFGFKITTENIEFDDVDEWFDGCIVEFNGASYKMIGSTAAEFENSRISLENEVPYFNDMNARVYFVCKNDDYRTTGTWHNGSNKRRAVQALYDLVNYDFGSFMFRQLSASKKSEREAFMAGFTAGRKMARTVVLPQLFPHCYEGMDWVRYLEEDGYSYWTLSDDVNPDSGVAFDITQLPNGDWVGIVDGEETEPTQNTSKVVTDMMELAEEMGISYDYRDYKPNALTW